MNVDVELALTSWLSTQTWSSNAIRCVTELPADLIGQVPLIQVQRIGGTDVVPGVDDTRVDIVCFATTYADASLMAREAHQMLCRTLPSVAVTGGSVLSVRTESAMTFRPYDNPNVRRFDATYIIRTQSSEGS